MSARAEATKVALLAFSLSFVMLIANGRAIGSGDTNALEKTAASLATRGTFILTDEGTNDPFTRAVPGGRISIYPALPALIAAPFMLVFGFAFDLNMTGIQVAGKLTAAFLAAGATGLLARSFARRSSPGLALTSALLFGLGTSVYSTAQALWQHPAVVLFLVIALSALESVESQDGAMALRAGMVAALSLSLAAAARPAVIPMCLILFLFLMHRTRRHVLPFLGIGCIPAAAVGLYNALFFGAPWRFGPPGLEGRFFQALPESIAGLLVSPARGLFVFTPIAGLALWGLGAQAREKELARGLLAAVVTHFVFISTWNEWHGGESFGPRLLTDLLPALFFFLPETLSSWPRSGGALGILAVSIQLLGGWTYDYRWERLHQRGRDFGAALWSWGDSPIAFAIREGVVIQGLPEVEARRFRLPLSRRTPFDSGGSLIEGAATGLRVSGETLLRDIHLERGGRVADGWILLSHPGDALAFRSVRGGQGTLRITGMIPRTAGGSVSGQGVVSVETRAGKNLAPVLGNFDLSLPFSALPGDEVLVRAQTGELRLARVLIEKTFKP